MAKSRGPLDDFPARLQAARELRGLNQSELATRASLQPSAVSHFETGTRKPSFDNLKRLADALDVTTDYLLGRVDVHDALAGADELHRHYGRLSADDRTIAEELVKILAQRTKMRSRKEE